MLGIWCIRNMYVWMLGHCLGVGLGSIIKFKVCGPAGSIVFLRS